MSNMIGLTKKSDNGWVLVNADHIVFFYEVDHGGTFVSFSNGAGFDVTETMTEINDMLDVEDYEV